MANIDIKSILKSYLGPPRKINLSREGLELKQEKRHKSAWIKKFFYGIFLTIFIFLVGGVAGIIFDRWFIPYLVTIPAFGQFSWLKRIEERTIIVNRTEEIKISEDLAMVNAISKVKPSTVKVIVSYELEEKAKPRSKKLPLTETVTERVNGLIITSDGLILARPSGFIPLEVSKDKELKSVSYKVILVDKTEFDVSESQITRYGFQTSSFNPLANLIILKVKADNLPVLAFSDSQEVQSGENVAVIGAAVARGVIAQIRIVEPISGAVPKKEMWQEIIIDRDLPNDDSYRGAILVNLKGEILGLNIVDSENKITNAFIPINDIKPFIDSAIGKLR